MGKAESKTLDKGSIASQLAALQTMTTSELAEKFCELFGQPTRSRNKPYLQKRLAFRIQELAEGGLSQSALAKIAELGDEIPRAWRNRIEKGGKVAPDVERDSRLPAVGTTLTRTYQDKPHRVRVDADGFLYARQHYKSLSAIARVITGTSWNGFLFFGLEERGGGAKK
jgi:transposase-like protein